MRIDHHDQVHTLLLHTQKTFNTVEQGVYRGMGRQSDRVFHQLLDQYKFKTVVSLTGEAKEQEKAVTDTGGKYVHYNWHGSGLEAI